MTVQDVAEYLNVDPKTVYRMVKRGEFPGFEAAGIRRFRREDIDPWSDDQKQAAARRGDEGQ